MNKHTPGPWLPSRITRAQLNIVQVGTSFRCNVVGDDNGAMVSTVHGRTERECGANARLIAAAPDLLEAMTELLDANSYYFPVGNPWGDKARAAIAKASSSSIQEKSE